MRMVRPFEERRDVLKSSRAIRTHQPELEFLTEKARWVRDEIIEVAVKNGAGHIAPSLSCSDILVALYYGVMNYRHSDPLWPQRDRLIISKAHGAYGVFPILADLGVIPPEEWKGFYTDSSTLTGCIERRPEYGLEAGCGSLGHGLPLAVGAAFGARLRGESWHTYCLLGDGEMQEGTTWEAVQFAVKHELSNLTMVVDNNRLQAMDFTERIMNIHADDLVRRMRGFGLDPVDCPGHDLGALVTVLSELKQIDSDKPGVVNAITVKGYGLKCMENIPKFHFRIPTQAELDMGRR